jgi:hypothetical protein
LVFDAVFLRPAVVFLAVDFFAVERLAVDFLAVERFWVDFFAVERLAVDFFRDDVPPLREDEPPDLLPARLRPPLLLLREEEDFVSPASARCLLTVRAAISFARFVDRPCSCSDSLTCSYCRSRLALHDPWGIALTS